MWAEEGEMDEVNRRDFAGMLAAVLGAAAFAPEDAAEQEKLAMLQSGVFKPAPYAASMAGH